MDRRPRWIETTEDLTEALADIGDAELALDLEADSFHRYRERVCLVQVSAAGRDLLIDPLAGVDLGVLAVALGDRSRRKLLHGADYDLRLLDRDHGLEVRGLFDTMVAARLAGETAFGLAALLDRHLGVRLDKAHQRADWAVRPLPPAMASYAVEDTRHLAVLAGRLEDRLAKLGRLSWAEEEFRRLEAVRWTASDTPDPARYLKVKGAARLDPRSLTVLRELHAVRDRLARERDVPPFRVASDAGLIELATRRPERRDRLAGIGGIPRGLRAGRGAGPWLEAIARGVRATPVPRPERRRRDVATPEERRRVERLARGRDVRAAALGVERSLVASRRVLEGIAQRLGRGDPWDDDPDLRDWQRGILAEIVESAARG